jgi:hypothetical protein
MKPKLIFIPILTIPLLFSGCASILDSGPKTVQLHSNPEGAKVTIFNKAGSEVSVNTTPSIVTLERGGFYSTENYRLVFEMPGYRPYEAHVESELDGWYLGNIIFGGVIGILIVDPATGDMWTLSPREVDCNLVPTQTTSEQLISTNAYQQMEQNVINQTTK